MTSAAAGLFLVAPAGLSPALAARLGALLQRRLLDPLPGSAQAPEQQLQQLLDLPGGWLQPLAVDPASDVSERVPASCWAELLGAWRFRTCLLVSEEDLRSGRARSQVVLLQHYKVPVLGVVQCGGPWLPQARRRDGLPWLGWLADAQADPVEALEEEQELQRLLRLRLGPAGL
jgi:hypothetical protein